MKYREIIFWAGAAVLGAALYSGKLQSNPRFAACIETPRTVQKLPETKAEVKRFIRYYKRNEP